jgi:metallo-beta-lactamase class B
MRTARRALVLILPLIAQGVVRAQESEPKARTGLDRFAKAIARARVEKSFRAMNRPVEPFRVIGNIYYVGASDVSSFLITTPEGHILLDSGVAETVPLIREGVETLGFRFEEVKVLLNSHAHVDHAGGHALVKRLTGARIVMSEADAALLAAGGKGDVLPLGDDLASYEPARADQVVGDGGRVTLGGVTLTAHLTPGHTRGCTTWTTTVDDGGTPRPVVFYGSTTLLPGVRLVANRKYPGIADDFASTFRTLKGLPCDVFLAPHGAMFGLEGKARRLKAGASPNPFLDPEGYRAFVARSERVFLDQLRREKASVGGSRARPPSLEGQPIVGETHLTTIPQRR